MKILLLSLEPPSLIKGNGGISQQLFYMIQSLEEHTIDVITYLPGDEFKNVTYILINNIINNNHNSYIENIHAIYYCNNINNINHDQYYFKYYINK